MTDVDNVSKKILADAALEKEKILNDAKEKASSIIAEAENSKKKILKEGKKKAEERYRGVYNLEVLKAKARFDQKLLLYKLRCVDEVIEKAKKKLSSLGKEDYGRFLKKSLSDLTINDGFYQIGYEEKNIDDGMIQSIIREMKDMKLKKSNTKANFKTGLKITSGKAEYHISPEGMIEAEIDDIKMEIAHFLFGEEA